ncbi:MAG: 50S ribosomal protein L23 [Candidatus Pacebacteria bacterium]|nr:50S ribosomal protein L23 [Candidatus Paceibacterota bacterium]
MALFGKGKASETEAETKTAKEETTVKNAPAKKAEASNTGKNIAAVILRPHVTEKAALAIDKNVYTFEVARDATKYDVRDAIKAIYNVTPIKVNIVKRTTRHYVSRMRGRNMTEKGMKKAYVYLKEGDRIDLV